MGFKRNLVNQIKAYIEAPENIIDEAIKAYCKNPDLLTEKQLSDICSIRRNNLNSAAKFVYSLDELDLIIEIIDSDPSSGFAKLKDAISQIEMILGEEHSR